MISCFIPLASINSYEGLVVTVSAPVRTAKSNKKDKCLSEKHKNLEQQLKIKNDRLLLAIYCLIYFNV